MKKAIVSFLKAVKLYPLVRSIYVRLTYWSPSGVRLRSRMIGLYSQFVRPGAYCFDVGANEGNRIAILLKLGAKVVAVEPQEEYANLLKRKYSGDSRVVVVQTALGEAPGSSEMMIGSIGTLSSLSKEWVSRVQESKRFKEANWDKKVTVAMSTLDELIKTFGPPSFCKIDVEGYELQVLKGLSQPISSISFEFTPEFIGPTVKAIKHLAKVGKYGFNYSEGETMRLTLAQWVGPDKIISVLENLPDKTIFGDVYALLLP